MIWAMDEIGREKVDKGGVSTPLLRYVGKRIVTMIVRDNAPPSMVPIT
jgi:hypothetical protein